MLFKIRKLQKRMKYLIQKSYHFCLCKEPEFFLQLAKVFEFYDRSRYAFDCTNSIAQMMLISLTLKEWKEKLIWEQFQLRM